MTVMNSGIRDRAAESPRAPLLAVSNVSKIFGGTRALKDVSLTFGDSEVHALLGENGAGKSTLIKLIGGFYPTSGATGTFHLDGQPVSFDSVGAAEARGIFLVPQELQVVPEMSVAENLLLNREPTKMGLVDRRVMLKEAVKWLTTFKLDIDPTQLMRELTTAQKQLVSIARAMSQGARLVVLDEPTAALTESEIDVLFDRIKLFRDQGVLVIYISHRLKEIARIADKITVMRDGRVVKNGVTARDLDSAAIIKAMVGKDIENLYPKQVFEPGKVLFAVQDLHVRSSIPGKPDVVDGIGFELHRGEVLGIYGVVGSGTTETSRSLFGVSNTASSARFTRDGETVHIGSPADAMRCGIGYIPDDRKNRAILPHMSVSSNMSIAALPSLSRFGIIRARDDFALSAKHRQGMQIAVSSVDQKISELSGGNQQKVIAGRWLATDPQVLIMHEPTLGVDVGARARIYETMNELAGEGRGILLVSSDLSEVMGMADRILVLSHGHITAELKREDFKEETIMSAAIGEHS
ncbi:sugar ABC transporter ATP-binding protein [Rhodococcus sp. IEGM 1354]|uniref:sugar ABC transporter ATP-binding protein n=1 Tax=Rhodococcus sp. IEGM 1354 TaxID=3047088 RepID=UPI0024B7749F|nr:sugar ABC transporter ATP-binding protein [Rhodococcus sp. IEGM 1354]MDI9933767.1 sugar ABC transporter ATP-binding protein [Rhodococcus sp. IEGM 1354]